MLVAFAYIFRSDQDFCFHFLRQFEIKLDDDYVKTSVLSILSKLYRNQRYKLHLHYKSFPNDEVARQNNPTMHNLSQENWKELCDLFNDPIY